MKFVNLGPGHIFDEDTYVDALQETLVLQRLQGQTLPEYFERAEADQRHNKLLHWIDAFTALPENLDDSVGPKITYLRTSESYNRGLRLAFQGVCMTDSKNVIPRITMGLVGDSYPEFKTAVDVTRSETDRVPTIWSPRVQQLGSDAYSQTTNGVRSVARDWAEHLAGDYKQKEYFLMAFCVGTTIAKRAVDYCVTREFATFMRQANFNESDLIALDEYDDGMA